MLGNRLNAFGQVLHDVAGYDAMQGGRPGDPAPCGTGKRDKGADNYFFPLQWYKSAQKEKAMHPREIEPWKAGRADGGTTFVKLQPAGPVLRGRAKRARLNDYDDDGGEAYHARLQNENRRLRERVQYLESMLQVAKNQMQAYHQALIDVAGESAANEVVGRAMQNPLWDKMY